jgi:MOSC domain-containing protein YiiM
MKGNVERIYIASSSRVAVTQVPSATLEAGKGIVGDRYHVKSAQLIATGNPTADHHLSLIAKEQLDDFLSNNNATIDYGDFRRSLITSGIDLNTLVEREFSIGDVVCRGIELCEPCAFLAATVHRAVLPELVHRAGLRAAIVTGGKIKTGDKITF